MSADGPRGADGVAEDLVTVAIPVRNEEKNIERCLRSVLDQSYTNMQIIVVDGESEDATQSIVKRVMEEDSRVELLVNPRRIVPSSLNRALAEARGLWWIRNDGHSTIPPDYVATAVARLRTGLWGGVGGRKDAVAFTDAGRAVAAALGSPFGVGNSVYHFGTEAMPVDHIPFGTYPVAVLRELGGWDEDMVTNQDYEFDYRVRSSGRELLFDPELHIDWQCPQTIKGFFRQYRRYGRGKINTLVRHPESGAIRHYTAPALVAALLVGGAFLPFRRSRRIGLVPFVAYGAAVGVASAAVAPKVEGARARRMLPAAFVAMHVGWGLGFWEELGEVRRRSGLRAVIALRPSIGGRSAD